MKTMQYKGYTARIEYSDEDKCFVGHIAGIRDIIGFHGESVESLYTAFEEAVDDYLEICKKMEYIKDQNRKFIKITDCR
ncbi:MAG: type II toxin-antitoxin system HicB family antitoxin [Treponema sp.]|nr:type II toxin-antitoxin system HicB family antitoxin [Treponema sp.]